MVLGIGFLLLVSLLLSALLSGLSRYLSNTFLNIPVAVLEVSNVIISFFVIFVLFMAIFRILPDVHIEWRHVWIGAFFTAALFVLGKYLIGLYLGNSSLSSTYGAAGSLVVLLLWVYYSAQILFLGAEFTRLYAEKYGGKIRPASRFMKYKRIQVVDEKAEAPSAGS
jgi:membrane protein